MYYTKRTTEDFIAIARSVHGNKYDYSESIYTGALNKILIICKSHGDFLISPNNHRRGRGCPSCAKHGYRRNKPGTLYVIQTENLLKVGITR